TIDPGTYVAGASLSLGLRSTGSSTSSDKIYLENSTRSYTFAQLGVTPPTTSEDGVVIDLSKLLAALQDGKLNLAILGDGGINWNNKPASGAAFAEYLSKLNAPLNVDVTALVQAALAGDKTLSLRLASITQSSAGQINYGARENSDPNLRPQLIIETFNASTPLADAYVRDGSSAALNFGTATDLSTKWDTAVNSGNNRDAYLKFDLTGVATAPAGA